MCSFIHTDRTHIRPLSIEDCSFVAELRASSGWRRFISNQKIDGDSELREYLRSSFLDCREERGYGYHLVADTQHRPLGIVGFLKKADLPNPDFGFAFLDEFAGRGLAHESAQVIFINEVIRHRMLNVDAVSNVDNIRAHKLLSKLGFRRHGNRSVSNPSGDISRLDYFRWHH